MDLLLWTRLILQLACMSCISFLQRWCEASHDFLFCELIVFPLVWRFLVFHYTYKELCKWFLCRWRSYQFAHLNSTREFFDTLSSMDGCFDFVNSPVYVSTFQVWLVRHFCSEKLRASLNRTLKGKQLATIELLREQLRAVPSKSDRPL